jgi:hypothetical protein
MTVWTCTNSQSVADDVRPSDKAVVRNVVYGLEQGEGRLYLTSQQLDGADRELKKAELKFAIPRDGEVDELSLSKMGEKNLVGVVKVRRGADYDFHCLTLIGPHGLGHIRDNPGIYQAKFFSTRENLRILAVNGKGNVAFVALGKLDWDEDSALVSDGVFYFSGCPWPPSDGQLAPFHAKSKGLTD